jgi:hypothetical protein
MLLELLVSLVLVITTYREAPSESMQTILHQVARGKRSLACTDGSVYSNGNEEHSRRDSGVPEYARCSTDPHAHRKEQLAHLRSVEERNSERYAHDGAACEAQQCEDGYNILSATGRVRAGGTSVHAK